jgi:hypothetical protein
MAVPAAMASVDVRNPLFCLPGLLVHAFAANRGLFGVAMGRREACPA